MDMNKEITVTQSYLKQAIDFVSASLVGKILKRFEILEDKEAIKKISKELIYEEFRHLRDILLAFNEGHEIRIIKFQSKNEVTK
jgi:hypothetical protein